MLAVRTRFVQARRTDAQEEGRAAKDVAQGHVYGADPRHRQRARRQRAVS